MHDKIVTNNVLLIVPKIRLYAPKPFHAKKIVITLDDNAETACIIPRALNFIPFCMRFLGIVDNEMIRNVIDESLIRGVTSCSLKKILPNGAIRKIRIVTRQPIPNRTKKRDDNSSSSNFFFWIIEAPKPKSPNNIIIPVNNPAMPTKP